MNNYMFRQKWDKSQFLFASLKVYFSSFFSPEFSPQRAPPERDGHVHPGVLVGAGEGERRPPRIQGLLPK
jgi:hypothetical protein